VTHDSNASLGHRVVDICEALTRRRAILDATTVTHSDLLLGRVRCDMPFAQADAMLKEVDKAVRAGDGTATVEVRGESHTLAGLRTMLVGALADVADFRT